MLSAQENKPERNYHDRHPGDLPPAYDALSFHQPTHLHPPVQDVGSPTSPDPVARPARLNTRASNTDESLPPRPAVPNDTPSYSKNVTRPRPRKNTSWLSHLPFASTFSAKRVRQSVMSALTDLVVPQSRVGNEEQKNAHEMLASIADTCAEHRLSLSAILQETFVADHTPMYWAVLNCRQELLVALLVHSRPLSIQTISDIRRACLASSNQALFHALRVCHPPFHKTDGIQVPSLRIASDNLLLGGRPSDEIRIQQASDESFVVSFDIPLWQRRMKAIGQVTIEFIVSGRMWSVTFFSTDPSSQNAPSGKSKKSASKWHVMVRLVESSPPTYFNSQVVVDVPPPSVPKSTQTPRLRESRSMAALSSRDRQHQSRPSIHSSNHGGDACTRSSQDHNTRARAEQDRHTSQQKLPSPARSLRNSPSSPQLNTVAPPPVSIRLGCGDRRLGCRASSGEPSKPSDMPTTKPDKWSDRGVGYTNAAVSPLGEDIACHLLYGHSRYLSPGGTLRARLEASLVKPESSKDCIIC